MKSKVALLLVVSLVLPSLGAQRLRPTKGGTRESLAPRPLLATQEVISWSGSVVIEEMADALVISPGMVMGTQVQAINLQLDREVIAEREENPNVVELTGRATVVYDFASRTWTVHVEDDVTGEVGDWQIVHPDFEGIVEETAYRRAVMGFYTYLMSEELASVVAGDKDIPWTGCPVGKHCCVAGATFAICDGGATPTCVCTTNSNGRVCSSRCVLMAV